MVSLFQQYTNMALILSREYTNKTNIPNTLEFGLALLCVGDYDPVLADPSGLQENPFLAGGTPGILQCFSYIGSFLIVERTSSFGALREVQL
jgi:hypothetical protein